jgi:hypothetical protein
MYCIDGIFFMVIWPSGLTSSFQFESYIGYFGLSPKCKEILWILELQRLHQILDHPPLIHREKSQNALFAKVGAYILRCILASNYDCVLQSDVILYFVRHQA